MTATVRKKPRTAETLAELLHRLGDVPPERVLLDPHPGRATAADVVRFLKGSEKRLVELVDGVLVEKPMGFYESVLVTVLLGYLQPFLRKHRLGVATAPDGTIRFAQGLVLIPDVAFFPWHLFPKGRLPRKPIPDLVPALAIEVLSESNRPGEMARKYAEYFKAGVGMVWEINPMRRNARILTSSTSFRTIEGNEPLTAPDILPGFALPLSKLFEDNSEELSDVPENQPDKSRGRKQRP